jgi:hypothetical protein
MTGAAADPANDGQSTAEHAALAADAALAAAPGASVPVTPPPLGGPVSPSLPDQRPELLVGAAFGGGLVLALLLKRLAR